jgi:hypothetical protein
VSDFAGIFERAFDVHGSGLGIAEHPQRQRPPAKRGHSDIVAKSSRQRAMLGGIVQRNHAIKMAAPARDVAHEHQGYAHEHVSDHARDRGALVLGKGVKLLRKLARDIALERHAVADPEAVENGKQQQRIVGGLSERFRSLDQDTRLLERCFGLGRCMPLGVDQRVREIDLQLDLLTA